MPDLLSPLTNPTVSQRTRLLTSSPSLPTPQLRHWFPTVVASPIFNASVVYQKIDIIYVSSPILDAPIIQQISISAWIPLPLTNPVVFIPGIPTYIIQAPLSGTIKKPSPFIKWLWYINTHRPLGCLLAWGAWPAAGVYFYRRKGGVVIMPLRKYPNPKYPAQVLCQTKFTQAIAAWQALDLETKRAWHYDCWPRGKRMSGWNWFISNYMRDTGYQPKGKK